MTNEEIGKAVRENVRILKAGAVGSGTRMKIDGIWVVVSVEPSATQEDYR